MRNQGIFGDSSAAPDPTRSRPVMGSNVGTLVPVDHTFPLTSTIGTRIDVTKTLARTVSMPIPPEQPGQRVDYGMVSPLTGHLTRTLPITRTMQRTLPIGPPRDPRPRWGAPVPLDVQMLQRWSGIFHRPPEVGPHRYNANHPFGPPVLGAFGNPDGLGGIRIVR